MIHIIYHTLLTFLVFINFLEFDLSSTKNTSLINDGCIKRSDNSFVSYNDTISPKIPLNKKVENEINRQLKSFTDYSLISIFEIEYKEYLFLYIYKIKTIGDIRYNFILYNKVNKKVSSQTFSITGTWMENNEYGFNKEFRFIEGPLLYFDDINKDNQPEVVIKERAHNGNVYNAAIEHYLELNPDKAVINQLLCVETKYINPFNNCLVLRKYSHNEIRNYVQCNDSTEEYIGKVVFDTVPVTHIISKEVLNREYNKALITGSTNDEIKFLKMGYIR